jgi:hypothetical protein
VESWPKEAVVRRGITQSIWLVLFVTAGAVSAVAESRNTLAVPFGTAPTLDGVLSESEWGDAIELPLADDTSLFVKHANGFLYLGVRTAPGVQVVGNVYIARGDTVEILHASHALGPATYRLEQGVWSLETPFVFSCRALGFSDAAVAEREWFLEENGWLATVVNLGAPEDMEYRIAIEAESMRVLFRFDVRREAQEVLTWPSDTSVGLEPGPLPQEAAFRTDRWCEVIFEASDRTTLLVPEGTVPTLDGTLSDDEWADAQGISLDDGTTLFLKHADGALFLGLSTRAMGVVSPCIVRGDDVWVLHASAALGTAVYEERSGAWTRSQDFTWSCRRTGFDEAALREREAFLEQEGWLGTIGYLGIPTDFEYRIDLLGEDSLAILFLFLGSGHPRRVLSWPVDLSGTSEYTALVTGPLPETMPFDIGAWARLVVEIED